MSVDMASSYFSDELGLDMRNSPLTPTLDMQDQYSGMMNNHISCSPGTFGEDLASYDYFSFDDGAASGFNVKSAPSNDFMEWSTTVGTGGQPTYTAPMPSSSFNNYFGNSEFNDGFVSPAALGPDTDSDSWSTGRKHSTDEQSAQMGSMSPPPSKKQCSSKAKSTSSTKSSSSKSSKSRTPKASNSRTGSLSGPPGTSGHGGNHNIQLRTASRKPKAAGQQARSPTGSADDDEDDDDDALTNEERRARRNHNNVEKQYRNRLNTQFEKLLAVLPAADQRAAVGGGKGGKGASSAGAVAESDDKRMSKAEVLDLARRRIGQLEDERRALQEERNRLMENVGQMQQAAIRQRMELAVRA
ncbi:hypothetical protein NKR23_g8610 [Pleurostoma richardsiae]|uniref:BHLH domain-containing protein n=1 Tax=Pleurostoma richardsiae TaxID=41990 RepID=A0AA38R5Q9_9PEZI|nr:hypothetical protein NKR23_g8610 [Pleurostoma richardsiae]